MRQNLTRHTQTIPTKETHKRDVMTNKRDPMKEGADVNEAEPHTAYTNKTYKRNPHKKPTQ